MRGSSRADLLESILNPDKQIAQGFESVVLATSDGKVHTGILRGEDAKEVRLMTAEGKSVTVPKDSIEERKRGPSAMPADVAAKLSKTELRDLIEFLASLKTAPQAVAGFRKVRGPSPASPLAATQSLLLVRLPASACRLSCRHLYPSSSRPTLSSTPLVAADLFFAFSAMSSRSCLDRRGIGPLVS